MSERLARPSIVRLKAYESARSLATSGEVFLDANEAPETGPFGRALHRYPSPQPPALLARFAELYGVLPENLVIGRGSDEAIDLLTRCFCEPRVDQIVISSPTYGMYRVAADTQDCAVIDLPQLRESGPELLFALDLEGLIARSRSREASAKIIYVCSPNNPTGVSWSFAAIERLCAETRETSLVVVDEAYAEFAAAGGFLAQALCRPGGSVFERFPNLVVLRTLSKAWAMAGARIGVAIASPSIIQLMQKVRAPYPLPQPCIELALEALSPPGQAAMRTRVQTLTAAREALAAELRSLPHVEAIADSDANFLLVRFADSGRLLQAARARGIVLRDRGRESGLANCVRITVGTPADNARVMEAVRAAGREAQS